jgi:hypothetical protein
MIFCKKGFSFSTPASSFIRSESAEASPDASSSPDSALALFQPTAVDHLASAIASAFFTVDSLRARFQPRLLICFS